MSEIKSYLSIESVPSLEFKTPIKFPTNNTTTNNSLSLSHTVGSLDNKSLWNRRTFYNSHGIDREVVYQPHDFVEERTDEIENNSSVTLSPALTPGDLQELANAARIVAFYAQLQAEGQARIDRKLASIKALRNQVETLEKKAALLKQEFERKEKRIKSRSLSIQKVKRAASKSLHQELMGMKLEMGQMKRTLSGKKATIETRRRSEDKRQSLPYPATERKREKLFVPIYSNRLFAAPENLPTPQYYHRNTSDYQGSLHANSEPRHRHEQLPMNYPNAVNRSRTNSNKNSESSSRGYRVEAPTNSARMKKHASDNQPNVLELIQEKLKLPSNPLTGIERALFSSHKVESRQNPQISTSSNPHLFEMLGQALNKDIRAQPHPQPQADNFHINILKEDPKPPTLDYFDDFDDMDLNNEMLLQSQQSRKSIKALKQSSKGLTNKWRKDGEEVELVEMLKESIPSPTKSHQSPDLQAPRSEIGAKLITTNFKEDSFNFDLPEKSREDSSHLSPKMSQHHSPRIQNSSQIEIFIMDNTDEKVKNDSAASEKIKSGKSIESRQNIINSSIGIECNDDSVEESIGDLPLSLQSKILNKNSPTKMIDKIEESPDQAYSRSNTPASPAATNFIISPRACFREMAMEPSVESRYTETPHQTQREAIAASSQDSLEKSGPSTPVLSKPPSLIELAEDDDDIIESIKLATQSRHTGSISKINRLSYSVEMDEPPAETPTSGGQPGQGAQEGDKEEEEEDDFRDIRLNNMSKISREKASRDSSSNEARSLSDPLIKMAQSELPSRSSFDNDGQGMDDAESELRKSTSSVIVKRGSAVQRSRKDSQTNSLRTSNHPASVIGRSTKNMSSPIEEADEEEEDFPSTLIKHRRNATDLPH